MNIAYHFTYDYIPTDIVEKEESYNEERQLRMVETIKNIIAEHAEKLASVEYKIEANKGEGVLTISCNDTEGECYKMLDTCLKEIGLKTDAALVQADSFPTDIGNNAQNIQGTVVA